MSTLSCSQGPYDSAADVRLCSTRGAPDLIVGTVGRGLVSVQAERGRLALALNFTSPSTRSFVFGERHFFKVDKGREPFAIAKKSRKRRGRLQCTVSSL